MARIFNIYFSYENVTYSAMVSVRETPFFTEYTLKDLNDVLLEQLPGNKIISSISTNEIFFQETHPKQASPLMIEILQAVQQHLHAIHVN